MAARYAVGVDVGGTKIYAGVIELESGKVVGSQRKRTHPERGLDFFVKRLTDVITSALDAADLPKGAAPLGIGVGIAGQVDRESGVLLTGPNLGQGLDNLPIRDLLQKQFKLPVYLGNDVEVATYGEHHYGAGRDCDDFVCIFVGTGIGAGIIQNGVMRRGVTGTAGEIGHTVVQYDGRLCGCGGRGHLEAYASRTAITRVLLAELGRGRESKLRELLAPKDIAIRSKLIARCIEEGDQLVIETVIEAADYLGAGISSLATFYNPDRIILGGGLIDATTLLFDRTALRTHESTLPAATRALAVHRAQLGDDSGIIGAAWMAEAQQVNALT
ncbi:MAG TPA: ROK family protein [Ktedonobacterales bacterium]|nr:ROK family protein [Ktedonobacterales bacterium]